eukprot:TRINITY_DN8143_c0_g2_i1.p1 TRINITY_DN8143_c0_g2~~TRINITY_DN8143_c0_g2_i1.p1  ORF type:complete len:264 (-),score=-9.33 TRINITY_DN8143_c0_g2_i1:86-877(-)
MLVSLFRWHVNVDVKTLRRESKMNLKNNLFATESVSIDKKSNVINDELIAFNSEKNEFLFSQTLHGSHGSHGSSHGSHVSHGHTSHVSSQTQLSKNSVRQFLMLYQKKKIQKERIKELKRIVNQEGTEFYNQNAVVHEQDRSKLLEIGQQQDKVPDQSIFVWITQQKESLAFYGQWRQWIFSQPTLLVVGRYKIFSQTQMLDKSVVFLVCVEEIFLLSAQTICSTFSRAEPCTAEAGNQITCHQSISADTKQCIEYILSLIHI